MKKRVYFNETPLWKEADKSDADIVILLSDRDCGKSFAVKYKILDNLPDQRFIYLRRNDLEITTGVSAGYFADQMLMKKIKSMGYEAINDWRGEIYLGRYDETGKRKTMINETFVGFTCSLFAERYYKSQSKYSESNVKNVIYEEFITDGLYLKDEPAKLESFWSTVARDNKVKIWLIGNTMSRVCPYFSHWGLRGVPRQKAGTIERYIHKVEIEGSEPREIKIDVVVIPDLPGQTPGWFSKKKTGTGWVTGSWPHLEKRLIEYTQLHQIFLVSGLFKFNLRLLYDEETAATFWYVEPMTREIPPDARVIATTFDKIVHNPSGTVGIRPLIPEEKQALDLLKNGHWVVSDNLTGDDFDVQMKNMLRVK